MTNKVIQRNIHISHRKAQLVCDLVRNKKVEEAITILENTNKKMAPIIKKLLESAIANSINNHAMNAGKLYIYNIAANQGPTWKRTMPRAKGSADMMFKRTTHVEIVLSDNPNERNEEIQARKDLIKKQKEKKLSKVVDSTTKFKVEDKTEAQVEKVEAEITTKKPVAKKSVSTTKKPVAKKTASTNKKPATKVATKKAVNTTKKAAAKGVK